MNAAMVEKGAAEANAAGKTLSESSISRRDYEYREAVRKATLWSGLGQLREAQKNGIIRRETVENLRKAKRD